MSHAGYNEFCKWRELIPQDRNYQEAESEWAGIFYAKEEMGWQDEGNEVGGAFRFSQSTITISTPDFVDGMDKDDIIQFREKSWKVVKVQRRSVKVSSEFQRTPDYVTYITMRL